MESIAVTTLTSEVISILFFYLIYSKGELKHIQKLRRWELKDVLLEKYHYKKEDAESISEFLGLILKVDTEHRSTANEMLKHKWLKDVDCSADPNDVVC